LIDEKYLEIEKLKGGTRRAGLGAVRSYFQGRRLGCLSDAAGRRVNFLILSLSGSAYTRQVTANPDSQD